MYATTERLQPGPRDQLAELARIRALCPPDVSPEVFVRHLIRIQREHEGCIREQAYRPTDYPAGWGGE